ncbi:putative DUF4845 domain-containing protein [Gammaproteobacteria bacterium]
MSYINQSVGCDTMSMQTTQRGMTFWGVLVIMAMVGFFVLLAMRLLPVYGDDLKINKALEALKTGTEGRTREVLVEQFLRQLDVNDIRSIRPEDLKLEPRDSGFSANLNYEIRVPILYNVDAMVKFSHHQDIR